MHSSWKEPTAKKEMCKKSSLKIKESYNDEPLSDEDFDLGKIDFSPIDNTTFKYYKNPKLRL